MAHNIESVSSRGRLKARREPYWDRVKRGLYVGYRKMSADTGGTWIARLRLASGKQSYEPLGPLEDVPAHERYDRAVEAATAWAARPLDERSHVDIKTVGDACDAYVRHLMDTKGAIVAKDVEARFRRWCNSNRIWNLELKALTREDCREFRRSLAAAPVKILRAGSQTAERSKSSVNRDLTPLRAALNYAYADGKVSSDSAWRETLKPFKNADRRRELYLDKSQRQALIAHAQPDLATFLNGLGALPLRPGALAALVVSNFEPRLHTLKIGKDKHGQDRKLTLGTRVSRLFSDACAGKGPNEPIFTRSGNRPWNKDAWKDPIKEAAAKANLPPETTAYTLRHSVITDLVHGGLDLLTVAQISGTSVAMIERHYGHMRGQLAAAALERLIELPEVPL